MKGEGLEESCANGKNPLFIEQLGFTVILLGHLTKIYTLCKTFKTKFENQKYFSLLLKIEKSVARKRKIKTPKNSEVTFKIC